MDTKEIQPMSQEEIELEIQATHRDLAKALAEGPKKYRDNARTSTSSREGIAMQAALDLLSAAGRRILRKQPAAVVQLSIEEYERLRKILRQGMGHRE